MKPKKNRIGLIVGVFAIILVTLTAIFIATKMGSANTPGSSQVLAETKESGDTANTPGPSENQTGNEKESADPSSDQANFIHSLISTDESMLTEQEKLDQIDFSNRVFSPEYHPAISLIAENGLDSGTTSGAPWACVVTPDGNQTKTFSFQFNQDVSASKIVWQVSLYPFRGGPATSSDTPGCLLQSGELSGTATSLTVDFSKVYAAETAFFHPQLSKYNIRASSGLIFRISGAGVTTALGKQNTIPLRTYYVRAFPVDSTGASISDAGTGLPVLYGNPKPATSAGSLIQKFSVRFSLMPAKGSGTVTHSGEFPNDFWDMSEVTMYNTDSKTYSVLPSGFPSNTQKLLLQVGLSDFTGSDWNNTPGLVYETSVTADDPVFRSLGDVNPYGISLDFSQFAPADSALPDDDYIRYYVRAIAMTEGTQPGTANASYSETIIINYGKYQAGDFEFYPEVKISPEVPTVESLSFTPVHWESPGWQYHYVVTRQPTEKEVFMGWGSNKPYSAYPVGTKLDFTPHPENKSWWEEAWDAISDFFGSIADFAAKLVNWVSNAYADLKSGIINIAVSALPDSWQGPMRTALTALADYGLASIGIPPTLPNFDDLANMGTDYLATVAMEQAGIPADSIITYGAEELSGKIGEALTSSAKPASPNPMNWDFVKLDPDYLYRPAYLTIELYNPYDEPTPAGKLSFTMDKFMDMSQNGFDPTITRLYALYGSPYVCLF